MFLGHLGDQNLVAGIGLGAAYVNIMGMTIIYGFNMAMDTLISQSAGAGNVELCGVYLNRGRFVMSILFVPFFVSCFFVETILIKFGMNTQVSVFAQ
jgi:Na+-driven multidrug efflux pump